MIVATEEAVAGFVPNVPVMPAGQPDAVRVTEEVEPFAGVIVTMAVPLEPGVAVADVALRLKPADAVPVVVKL